MSAASPCPRRPRILFVDDQRDVAVTLSKLLPKGSFECRFADDGEAALTRLSAEAFDLAVVDLRMPPDDWGGLWLLRELSERGLAIDTLVLSGEGGQSETIEAMRLAHDFVMKDKAAIELPERIQDVLARSQRSRADFAVNQLPTPIALPYQRMQVPLDRESQLRASLMTAEAVARFCALAAVSAIRTEGPLDQSVLTHLVRPSFGTWQEICRRLLPQVRDRVLVRWIEAVCVTEANAVVQHRNDVVHGGGAPASGWDGALADVLGWLDWFVLTARTSTPLELVVAGPMAFTGSTYSVDLAVLAGAAQSVAPVRADVATPLVTGRVYLQSAGGYVDMWPLVLADGAPTGDWTVKVVDGFQQSRHGETSTTDRLKYVDLSTGARDTSAQHQLGELLSGREP
ncbi:response regulator [Blastococcus brunescens]|uniref:Response regulator n=1 Tax=Blastococcus brunescens TaxID=1564165 RepID=A0ABZ1B5C8_9ACTN|nr:response regulator [Blastococcus sp. BMG 8361]WRL65048.1 response regulator [Blastococcus sp. BMG 8361]